MTEEEFPLRISKVIEKNDTKTAITKLLGYMKIFYGHPLICEQLANLYIEIEDLHKAGKYIFYKNKLSRQDEQILTRYYQSFGNDKVAILKDLMGNTFRSPSVICSDTKLRLFIMMNEVQAKHGFLPKFMKNWYKHFSSVFKDTTQ